MSENYPSDVKLNENQDGTVSFATEVIATIAGLAATEVDGVSSMVSPASGLADMFSRKNNRNLTKGVRIDLEGTKVTVDVTIVVDYGSPVPDVARNIQENVKKAIETMSGLDVKKVDVHVTDISFEREQRANAELDEQQRKMLEKTEEAVEEAVSEGAEAEEAIEETVEGAEEAVTEEIEDEPIAPEEVAEAEEEVVDDIEEDLDEAEDAVDEAELSDDDAESPESEDEAE